MAKNGAKRARVMVAVNYPTRNQLTEKTDESGRNVAVRITDEVSGQLLVELELSAAQWVQILASQYTPIDDALVSAYPHRLGKKHVRKQLDVWKISDTRLHGVANRDEWFESQRALAEATSGYEVVTIDKHNWGTELIGHAWVEEGTEP